MQSYPAKAIIYDTAKLSVEVSSLKNSPGIIRLVGIAKGPLVFVSAILYTLSRRIEPICIAGSASKI